MTTQVLIPTGTADNSGNNYTPSTVPAGYLRAFQVDGTAVTDIPALAKGTKLYFVLGTAAGETPIKSKIFNAEDYLHIAKLEYNAGTPQTTYVGYNGVSGAIDNSLAASASHSYTIKTVDVTSGYERFPRKSYEYVASAGATELAIANGLIAAIDADTSSQKVLYGADLMVDEASTQLVDDTTGANVTLAVTKGSTTVTCTVSADEDLATVVAGDYLRIGHATATTSPVYKIAVVGTNAGGGATTLTVTLEEAYKGETATGVAAGYIAEATAEAGDFGVRLIGNYGAKTAAHGAPENLFWSSFSTALPGEWGTTVVTAGTAPVAPRGKSDQVAELERKNWGVRGYYETNYFNQEPASSVVAGEEYDLYTAHINNDNDRNVLRENEASAVVVAIPTSTAAMHANEITRLETMLIP